MTTNNGETARESDSVVREGEKREAEVATQDVVSERGLERLLASMREMSDSERVKGSYLEQLIRRFLTDDETYGPQYSDVWLWRDYPERGGLPDTGVDLVARTVDGEDVAIQCKFYRPEYRIQKQDVDSFFEMCGREPFRGGIVVDTTEGQWSRHAEEALTAPRMIPIQRIGLDKLRASRIDWSSYSPENPNVQTEKKAHKSMRDHQERAVRAVSAGLKDGGRGKLVMACGTGKTYTALKYAEALTNDLGGHANICFMVPSLALMSQSLQDWANDHEEPMRIWAVCSDTKVGRTKNDDITDVALADLQYPATTDSARLAESFLEKDDGEGMNVVFCTYQSTETIHRAQQEFDLPPFDVIICDEAHRTTGVTISGEDESAFVRVHDNAYIEADRRLYMTATPRIYNSQVKNIATQKDAELCSMDDESLFGQELFRIGFGEAVASNLLTDYKVLVLQVSEEQASEFFQKQVADGSHELNVSDIAKLIGVWNGLAKRKGEALNDDFGDDNAPMRRAVAFAKNIKASKAVAEEFEGLVQAHLANLSNEDTTDDLNVECQHVDGTMNANERGEHLSWLKTEVETSRPVCRILTNARCLSEGVDVPSLDSVIFLSPRNSEVDVIQAVGRVMRLAPNKKYGYIILPVVIPTGATPESALNDNKTYRVVWQVLQALRAHDDRFDADINKIELNQGRPENILIDTIDLSPRKKRSRLGIGESAGGENTGEEPHDTQLSLLLMGSEDFKDAVYAKLVKKVGSRMYWDDWAGDISKIAARYVAILENSLKANPAQEELFDNFLAQIRTALNPQVTREEAIEMLAQHLLTKPLFDAMFPDNDFTEHNVVSQAMQNLLDLLAENAGFEKEREPLDAFYQTMAERIAGIDNLAGKQEILRTLFDKFFSKAFAKMADRLGIVFTPVPIVDFILKSANWALGEHFGKSLSDRGVSILEPFAGTGTFVARLLQLGLIRPEDMEHKYLNEIFANELVLLSYYMASINIETVYREIRREQGAGDGYVPFPGIALTDTFESTENQERLTKEGVFAPNNERVTRQLESPIRVIVMNPPYSVGQGSANDNNQNAKYPKLDAHIEATYAKESTATLKNSLYDSYFRALRWSTDRLGDDGGIIAFVSNNSFIDGNSADGIRKVWASEFSDIYIVNLRGNQRTQGEVSRKEGGKVFGSGSRTGVAVALLVKQPTSVILTKQSPAARIHYFEVEDYMTAQEKLNLLTQADSMPNIDFREITPNEHGDWINQRDDRFTTYQPIGDKATKGKEDTPALFRLYSGGLKTNRDAWCYNFSSEAVLRNVDIHIDYLNEEATRLAQKYDLPIPDDKVKQVIRYDDVRGTVDRVNRNDLRRGVTVSRTGDIRRSMYRPFMREYSYFDPSRKLNNDTYQLPQIFPTPEHENIAITVPTDGRKEFSVLISDRLYDLSFTPTCNGFPLYAWEKVEADDGGFNLDLLSSSSDTVEVGGYRRRENITDATLAEYRRLYKDTSIEKEDIFYYVYALLHHPEYRERYEADLKKLLPHIPHCEGFREYERIGRELADMHVNYEELPAWESLDFDEGLVAVADPWERYRIGGAKMKWAKKKEVQADGKAKSVNDYTELQYNSFVTVRNIPAEANDYKIGGRSPLEWVVDRYVVSQDKKSLIVNDPNDWCREQDNPRYVLDLIGSLVTLSMRTQALISELPAFKVLGE